jgi:hypothetical protein
LGPNPQSPIPNPQSPIPNPQSPYLNILNTKFYFFEFKSFKFKFKNKMENEEEQIIQKEKIEISPKLMGKEFKKFIIENSQDYLARLKSEISKNFKIYYESLNNQVAEEQMNQEKQQNDLSEQMQSKNKNNDEIMKRLSRRKQILLMEKEHKYESDLKLKAFMSLYKNKTEQKEEKKKFDYIKKIILKNKKKKIFRAFKTLSLFQKSKEYTNKLENRKNNEINKLHGNFEKEKQKLLFLINQAKEKLKHENRKKIQVKLMLDQMILRGISALNMQAMKLSQNSLNDVVGCDYKKDIDVKYHSMLFPESKVILANSLQ